ncbi:hypothetical protein FHS35_007253 [Streptomyces umbrinus]|uniref:hypothetical protein n=1 Tax=Streptomyces umbrinus TaxID=67370 RepID=UPI001679F669|nr:hypothetical protein [Streptomyces umbrinus]MCR3730366.1 hypothetical protein [Streptomyces umbrinus]GHB83589.1 hypothetical protein GCM10010306_092770 [Streptomyces umbrinus]GHH58199.1 hypothetical protein GCM10018775_67440 [Streptomyces umbrinus]
MTEGRLRVSTEDLHTAGVGLRTVATEFEGLDKLLDAYDRRTVGHKLLQERLQEFSDGWNDNREKMIEEIKGLGEVAKTAGEAYTQIDDELYKALVGQDKNGQDKNGKSKTGKDQK